MSSVRNTVYNSSIIKGLKSLVCLLLNWFWGAEVFPALFLCFSWGQTLILFWYRGLSLGRKRENELPIGAFFSLGSYRGYSLQMFTFVIGISCGNTPFVQKHESTTHVNGFVFDSIFSAGKYFVSLDVFFRKHFIRSRCELIVVRTFHVLTVSASQNQFLSQKREHPLTFTKL